MNKLELSNKLSKLNKHIIILAILLVLFVPYILGFFATPQQNYYLWAPIYNKGDAVTYIYKMQIGYSGEWLYKNFYDIRNETRSLFFTFYILLGHIARVLNLNITLLFHVARIVSGYFLLLMLYSLIKKIVKAREKVNFYFIIASLFYPVIGILLAEAYTSSSIIASPHMALSMGLYLYIGKLLMEFHEDKKNKFCLATSIFFLILIHPFMIFPINAFNLALFLKRNGLKCSKKNFLKWVYDTISINIGSLPYLIYILYIFSSEEFQRWITQSQLSTFPFLIMSFDVFLYFIFRNVKNENGVKFKDKFAEIDIWVIVILICVLLPFSFQRRMIEGLGVLIGISSAYFLLYSKRRVVNKIIILLMGLQLIYITIFLPIISVQQRVPTYISYEEKQVLNYFIDNNIQGKYVLSIDIFGLYMPAYTYNKSYIGHSAETGSLEYKKEKLFNLKSKEQFNVFISENNFDYIIINKQADTKLKKRFLEFSKVFKEQKVFENKQFIIYAYEV
ncbi:MAG: hypothetical protein ACOCQR_03295 [bacterium]